MREDIECYFSEWECEPSEGTDWYQGCATYPAIITWRHATCHYGQPVVLILDEPRGIGDMPPGELQVAADLVDELRSIGYQCQPMADDMEEYYWARAKERKMNELHWHPEARWVYY